MQTTPLGVTPNVNPATSRLSEAGEDRQQRQQQFLENRSPERDKVTLSSASLFNLKFNFFYEKVQASSRYAEFLEGDSARSVSQQLYQRVTAAFSFDFSMLQFLAEQTGRAASIDEEAFGEFVRAANGLSDFSEESLNAFLSATDGLFNAAEKAFGLGEDGLDDIAALFKAGVKGFFGEVANAIDTFDANEEESAGQFRQQLAGLLQPRAEADSPIARLNDEIDALAIPEAEKASLRKIAQLLEALVEESRKDSFVERLAEIFGAIGEPQPPEASAESPLPAEETAPEPRPASATIRETHYTQERATINIQQSQLDLIA